MLCGLISPMYKEMVIKDFENVLLKQKHDDENSNVILKFRMSQM